METRMTPELTEALPMVNVVVLDQINAGVGDIGAGENPMSDATERAEQARRHLVAVDPNAPSCCIDGRKCVHTLSGERTEPRASVSGGADITAFAAAEMVGDWFAPDDERPILERFNDIDVKLRAGGIIPGGHTAEAAVANNYRNPQTGEISTGCGANDKFTQILQQPHELEAEVTGYASALMGDDYRADDMKFVESEQLQARVSEWNPEAAMKLVEDKTDGKGVEVLEGAHAETLVIFNYTSDTTIDRDAFVAETGKQVFVVDMWYIDKMARAMAAGRPDAVEMYSKMKHAMVAFQLATYLTLCDGSQRPVLLTPETESVAA